MHLPHLDNIQVSKHLEQAGIKKSSGCLVSTTTHDIQQEGQDKVDYKPNNTQK